MARKEMLVSAQYVYYSGVYDYDALLKIIKKFTDEYRYILMETKHTAKDVKTLGKELDVNLELTQDINDYFGEKILIEMFLDSLVPIEIKKKGEVIKAYEGLIKILIMEIIIVDNMDRFPKTSSGKINQKLWERFVKRKEIIHYGENLYFKCEHLKKDMFDFFYEERVLL